MSVSTAIKERATEYHQAIIDRNPMAEAWGFDEAYIKGATDQQAIDEQELKPKWIPVSERLPEKDGWYLVTIGKQYVSACRYYYSNKEWIADNVTHWMLLPPAPSK